MDSKLNLVPMGLLSAFTLKLLITGASAYEMGIIFALSAGLIAFEYLSKSRRIQSVLELNKEFQETLTKQVADQIHVINKQNEVISKLATELAECRNAVNAVKASSGLKRVGS